MIDGEGERAPAGERMPGPRRPPAQARRRSQEPGESPERAFSVDDLSQLVRTVVQGSFPPVWMTGEVSQFTEHRSGHWYFTLKGQRAAMRCVMWATDRARVPAAPDEGTHVVVFGQVDVYPARTELQFVVRRLDAVGDGLWRRAFEQARANLAADGLLDPARKRRLPFLPRTVAVITSRDGAAFHDVVSVVRHRNPLVSVVLVPALVQGEDAPRSLRTALARLTRWGGADVVIIGRGGGAREELWAFNDEALARAVASCPVPTISAVGHEVDVTICDLVADVRAPTPSAAAERAVPALTDLEREVRRLGRRLQDGLQATTRQATRRLHSVARRAQLAAVSLLDRRRLQLERVSGRLHALSPLATLGRGYALVTDADGHVVSSVRKVAPTDALTVRVRDGQLRTRVESVEPGGGESA